MCVCLYVCVCVCVCECVWVCLCMQILEADSGLDRHVPGAEAVR